MAALSEEQPGRLWLVVLQSTPASHMVWKRKYPQHTLLLLAGTSTWGEEEEQGLEQRSASIVTGRAEWTQQSRRGGSPPFTVVCSQGKLFEGEYVMALSFQVRQCKVDLVGP